MSQVPELHFLLRCFASLALLLLLAEHWGQLLENYGSFHGCLSASAST